MTQRFWWLERLCHRGPTSPHVGNLVPDGPEVLDEVQDDLHWHRQRWMILKTWYVCLSVCLSDCLCVCLSVCLSLCLFVCLFVCIAFSTSISVGLPIYETYFYKLNKCIGMSECRSNRFNQLIAMEIDWLNDDVIITNTPFLFSILVFL